VSKVHRIFTRLFTPCFLYRMNKGGMGGGMNKGGMGGGMNKGGMGMNKGG
jgi:hypothetical protein